VSERSGKIRRQHGELVAGKEGLGGEKEGQGIFMSKEEIHLKGRGGWMMSVGL